MEEPVLEIGGIPEPEGWDDALTGLEGPDFWRRVLVSEVDRASRYRRSLTVVVVELEGLVELAETRGLDTGRRAVREAGQCLRRASRTSEYVTRIGVSRFGIILTETDEIAAINFVERVRESGPRVMALAAYGIRFRFGWASPKPGEPAERVVQRAEHRLLVELDS